LVLLRDSIVPALATSSDPPRNQNKNAVRFELRGSSFQRHRSLVVVMLALGSSLAAREVAADYPEQVRQDRPVAYWRFDEVDAEPGARAASDVGPHAAEYRGGAELRQGPPGIGGHAVAFERPGAHVWVPPHADFNGNCVSVEFWFTSTQTFPDRYWPGSATFVSKATAENASSDWLLIAGCAADGGQGRVIAGSGSRPGGDVTLYSTRALNDGQWHHVVWTRAAAGDNRLYVDGEPTAAASDGGGNIGNERPITIGGDPVLGGRDLQGLMDEVAVYDHVLAPERVRAHYQSTGIEGAALFARHVAPLFEHRCLKCHAGEKPKGGLDLTTQASLAAGGESGAAVVPGDPEQSLLYRLVAHQDEPAMPEGDENLPDESIAHVAAWIKAGAPYTRTLKVSGGVGRDFWSLRPLEKPALPEVKGIAWPRTDIDRFVLAALEARAAPPAAEADRSTLIRRLYFDLLGLPPEPDAVQAFVDDPQADAYERLVDRLLASPHYGERWGRHWLDVARYADSAGYEADEDRLNVYYYRDFVIQALNEDLPFDQFVRWQLAGDEYAPDDPRAQAATGFLAVGPALITDNGTAAEREQYHYDQLDDMVSTLGSAMLGLTTGCARCHDHKFDPIPTLDYYRLAAAFGTFKRVHLAATPSQQFTHLDMEKTLDPASRLLLTDSQPQPKLSWLLSRGDPQEKVESVTAGFLGVLTPDGSSEHWLQKPDADAKTTLQRKALAEWITDVERGAGRLLARVVVNRLWLHHFGEGIVRTPNDFGVQGDRPINPALIDALAGDLVAGGWRLKPVHRQLVLSATYRQRTTPAKALAELDPGVQFYFRRPLRLESEAVRDSILAVSGLLNRTLYGPPIKPFLPAEAQPGRNKDNLVRPDHDGPDQWRRSIYLFVKRTLPTPLLETFDSPVPTASCGRRTRSTVPTQALALLNDAFVRNQARRFAERVRVDAPADVGSQVDQAYRWAFGRRPTAKELEISVQFLAAQPVEQALDNFCHVLFGLNEFIFVD
jgi:cytochrome c553